jgi:hypothetical protein
MDLLGNVDFKVSTVILDKEAMLRKTYWQNKNPYHYCMEILLEKFVLWLDANGGYGDIMPEKRQGKKDGLLEQAFKGIYGNGTRYLNATLIQKRLDAKTLKFREKKDNITGLQICDLMASPSHKWIKRLREGKGMESLSSFDRKMITIASEQKI